jgi:SNF2 family DNA or RNA helicase
MAALHLSSPAVPASLSAEVLSWDGLSLPEPVPVCLKPEPIQIERMSVPMPLPRVAVRSYAFRQPVAMPPPVQKKAAMLDERGCDRTGGTAVESQRIRARIKPPGDVVKLSERIFYLLQPDLETILETSDLVFPHNPYPFQYEGMAFLAPRHSAVLADEMGLGKSMQAISTIRLLVHGGEARRVLVVCPKGLVSNWKRELGEWAPELVVAVIEGEPARRRWQWQLDDVPVTLANYEVLVRDEALVEELKLSYDLVVLDEAQRIKNRGSRTSEAVRGLRRRRSWALTGTPVENSAADLVGLFEFVSPGLIHDGMPPRTLGESVADHVLRRTKDKVLKDLPPRIDRDAIIELSPEQRETYRLAEEEGVFRLSEMGPGATIQHVFELVLRLKQICNFDPATQMSSKLDRLEAELEEVAASGRKAIVFSQWVAALKKISARLARFGPLQYHGGMPTPARDEAIRLFREKPEHSVLLLSYGAGAVGLNLQFSEYVFLFDRWWNPAIEDQAINRAHRIGGTGGVTVTRFLATGTIEERIDKVLAGKRDLSEMILSTAEGLAQEGQRTGKGFTQEELFSLFNLPPPVRRAAAA